MTPIQRTNPHLEFLCIAHEETGEIYLHQFHHSRTTDIEYYFRAWTKNHRLPGKFVACIKVLSDQKFIVVEEGYFKLTA